MYISLDNAGENTVNNLNRNFSVDDIENHMKFNIFYEIHRNCRLFLK